MLHQELEHSRHESGGKDAPSAAHATVFAEKLQTLEDHLAKLQNQLVRAQRLASLGTMASMIAHEFNNLLTPVVSYAQYALTQQDPDLWRKALERAFESGRKAAEVAQELLSFSRGTGKGDASDVPAVVESAIRSLGRDLAKDNIQLRLELAPARAAISPHLLQQVLFNLILNARQAMLGRPGRLHVSAAAEAGRVSITVRDSGPGIPPDILPRIFDPFFTTKGKADRPDLQGSGLGLAISKQIVAEAGGEIAVESRPGEGACFTIILPAAAAERAAETRGKTSR